MITRLAGSVRFLIASFFLTGLIGIYRCVFLRGIGLEVSHDLRVGFDPLARDPFLFHLFGTRDLEQRGRRISVGLT